MNQYGVVGDNVVTDLPQTQMPEADLNEEKKLAKFSQSEEFKRLKKYLEGRIKFYQSFLPDGRDVRTLNQEEAGSQWVIANAVVGEIEAIINEYERAQEVVKESKKNA